MYGRILYTPDTSSTAILFMDKNILDDSVDNIIDKVLRKDLYMINYKELLNSNNKTEIPQSGASWYKKNFLLF